ncbi:MAG: type II secretory pathway component PulF [Francisellaceae bacterium]|jgi:type II secretory pathway component PulF
MDFTYFYCCLLDSKGKKYHSVRIGVSLLQIFDHFALSQEDIIYIKKIPNFLVQMILIFKFIFPWFYLPKRERLHLCYKLGSMLADGHNLPESLEKCALDTRYTYLRQILFKAQLYLAAGKNINAVFEFIVTEFISGKSYVVRNIQNQNQLSIVLMEIGKIYNKKLSFTLRLIKENAGIFMGIILALGLSHLIAKYIVADALFALSIVGKKLPDSLLLYYKVFYANTFLILFLIAGIIFLCHFLNLISKMFPVFRAFLVRFLTSILLLKSKVYPIYKVKLLEEIIFLLRAKYNLQDALLGSLYSNRYWVRRNEMKNFSQNLYMGQPLQLCLGAIKIFRKSDLGTWSSALMGTHTINDLENLKAIEQISLDNVTSRSLVLMKFVFFGVLFCLISAGFSVYMMSNFEVYT